jgi:hypothetical protein
MAAAAAIPLRMKKTQLSPLIAAAVGAGEVKASRTAWAA